MDKIAPIEETDGQVQKAVTEHIVEETTETNQTSPSSIETSIVEHESETPSEELKMSNVEDPIHSSDSQSIETKIEGELVEEEAKVAEPNIEVKAVREEIETPSANTVTLETELAEETLNEQTAEPKLLSNVTIEQAESEVVKEAEPILEVKAVEEEVATPSANTVTLETELAKETLNEQTAEPELLSNVTIEQAESEVVKETEPNIEVKAVEEEVETTSANTVTLEPGLVADTVIEQTAEPMLSDVVLEQSKDDIVKEVESVTEFENETTQEAVSTAVAIEQENVQELKPVQETALELEPEIVLETKPEIQMQEEPKRTGSRVPFNVVMLKSDKAKMEQSRLQEIPLPGIKSFGAGYTKSSSNQTTHVTSPSTEPNNVTTNTSVELDSANHDVPEEKTITSEVESDKFKETPPVEVEHDDQVVSKEQIETMQNHDTLEQLHNTIEVKEPAPLNEHLEEALTYLEPPEEQTEDFEWMDSQGEKLIEALSYFQVNGEIVQIVQGPAVTQFEITVGHGIKVSKIRNLADDLKLALAAKDIRIQAPIPGKSSIGIEIPNRKSRPVRLSEVVTHSSFVDSKSPLEAALGLDLTGEPVTIDLRKMPHGMIAGATGSGKSVCINSLLISLLLKASPQDVKLMLIDPKMVELAPFNHIPHLVSPVITDVKAATAALKWAVDEMDRRYQLFAHVGARDITRYNKMVEKERKFSLKMPYLVIVIDELADLMMMSPQEVEESICRIAQKARACGIHLVLATQRPSVDVITGLIKSNIPTRIAFSVSSHIDSRTILDSQGAERLLGRGDMLYLGNGMSAPVRVQGTYVTDDEIEAVTNFVRTLGEPEYLFQQEELLKKVETIDEQDELFEEACRYICNEGSVSASSLQRKYRIGYNRAARLVDMMEAQGFISESRGTKPREVFLTERDLDDLFG